MYRYKIGDVCPFCGRPIPEDATPAQLYSISILAATLNVVDRNHKDREPTKAELPEIRCDLVSRYCPANAYDDHRCCKACDLYGHCPHRCLNNPGRCGMDKTTYRGAADDE